LPSSFVSLFCLLVASACFALLFILDSPLTSS
jgi:hypothetical protein